MTALSEQTEVVLAANNPVAQPLVGGELADDDLAEIVRLHQADIWRYLRYLGAAGADADDLTQETFLALSRSTFEQRSPGETAGYLRKVARNQLLMLRRKQGRALDTVELDAAERVWATTVGTSSMDALLATLAECLETLEGRARQAVDLFYRDSRGRSEVATAMQMKPDGVKTLLRRTRDVLRDCIERKMK